MARITMTRRSGSAAQRAMFVVALTCAAAGVSVVPSAVADPSDTLRAALMAARATSCAPLRSDPILERAADIFNRSDDDWLEHTTRAVPVEVAAAGGAPADPLPTLKGLGHDTSVAALLSGAAGTEAVSIEAVLLQGYAKIPNCSYTVYGVSARHNSSQDLTLTTIVLAA